MDNLLSYIEPKPPSDDDRGTLRLLGIFNCIIGGCEMLGFILMFCMEFHDPKRNILLFFFVISAVFIFSGAAMLLHRFRYFSFWVAIFTCLAFPVGTMLGIWTIIVLNSPGVARLYTASENK
jgi:hypothetical protein